ncbi:MAG: hypothetical protein IJQ01_06215 [Selenomonadaceae bacterium]|nr:hypothetical protein [Selenomonadaceae bacterium]
MQTIIIKDKAAEKAISHPQYGTVRYFVLEGGIWLVRADVAKAFGLSAATGHCKLIAEKNTRNIIRSYCKTVSASLSLINDEGLKKFASTGVKNLERRMIVRDWLLKSLYGEKVAEAQPTLFESTPVTLNAAQRQEIVDDVAAKFQNRPINLTDKQMDDIAFKVLALIEAWKPDEDKIVDKVLEKFLGKFAAK